MRQFIHTLFFSLTCILLSINAYSQISDFIHIDQFGYHETADKIAVISDPQTGFNSGQSYTPGSYLEVRDLLNDVVVLTVSPTQWDNGNTHIQSGDRGWWLDFSSVTTPGTYYIYDPSTSEKSGAFEINANPYKEVLNVAAKMFYYNRCNYTKEVPYAQVGWTDGMNFKNALQDQACRYIYDQNNASLEKDLTGGWFDAGDYNKYITFANEAVHPLLNAYQDNPSIFTDDWNIPESGNGLPDILDEVKWELDWLKKMANTDGTVHIKMGSNDYVDNTSAPPSINTDNRYYGPVCSSASIAMASMLAHAAVVYEDEPGMSSFAQELEDIAIDCWDHFLTLFDAGNLETDCDDISIIAGDADKTEVEQKEMALLAAVYLFERTGQTVYSDFLLNHYDEVEPISTGFWSPYRTDLIEALLHYTTLPGADTNASSTIISSATSDLNNNFNYFFAFSDDDLYRALAPDWMYHWGSNKPKAALGVLCSIFKKYNLNASANAGLDEKAAEQLHYFHGVNPLGIVYLSNMYGFGGDRCADEIYHTWFYDGTDWDNASTSTYGPAPGFLAGGPNKDFSISTITPPSGQPDQKSYKNFNDGYPNNSWEITEPSITYQAIYVRFLAAFVNTSVVTSNTNIAAINSCLEIFPNPTGDYFRIKGLLDNYKIEIIDSNGSIYETLSNVGSEVVIDVSTLPSGLHFVKVENLNNSDICVQKIVKE